MGLASCGGGGGGLTPDLGYNRDSSWPGHEWSAAVTSGEFAVVAVDETERQVDPLTAQLELSVDELSAGPRVTISASDLAGGDHAFLHLRYDAQSVRPVATSLSPGLDDEAVFLGITSQPGVVVLGLASIGGDPLPAGVQELCEVEFAPGAFAGNRHVSKVSDNPVTDLHFSASAVGTLNWTYSCKGDYDQNSEVNVADLTPIGVYFQANTSSPNWQAAQVADGDENGFITVSDLTPIGVNFLERLTAYQIQGGASEAGPFAGDATVAHNTGVAPDGGGFLQFSYEVPAPVEGAWYVVWAVDGTQVAGEHSNAAQYTANPTLAAPRNLSAVLDGDHIQLNWDAPSGAFPDGYEAYVSSLANLTDAIKMHSGILSGTTYDVPVVFSPDTEHYFGVKAIYGTERSAYSNVAHYTPGASDAPTNLLAVRDNDHVALSWDAPSGQVPDGYNAYRGSDGAMSDALQINTAMISGETFNVPLIFSPDDPHYFAVTAIYGTVESDYSNIFHYDPSAETDPPTWTGGGTGIKSVAPGASSVTVEWYEATDNESPPVTYLVYYEEEASFSWETAATKEVAAPDLSTVIGALTNNVTYEFGVRARDSLGNTDSNTNTLTATPVPGGVPVDSGVWQTSELVDDGGTIPKQEVGWFPDVEVKSDGTIGIAHYNNSLQDLMYTEKPSGGSWTTVTVDSESDTGLWPDLEFSPVTGEPCIAYHHAGAQADGDEALVYAEYNGSTWELTNIDTEGDVGAFASLEFDPADNRPAISYWNASAFDCKYAKFNGSSWDRSVVFNGSFDPNIQANMTGAFTSLAFNPTTGYPAVAFNRTEYDAITQYSAYYAEYNGSSWTSEFVDGGELGDELDINMAGWETNLAFTPAGVPYVSHYDLGVNAVRVADKGPGGWAGTAVGEFNFFQDQLWLATDIEWNGSAMGYAYYDSSNGNGCYGEGLGDGLPFESGIGAMPSLCITADGKRHVAYYDQDNQELRYSYSSDGSIWHSELASAVTGGTRDVGSEASLAYHPTAGYPLISYYDATDTALKFADKMPESWRKEIVANTGYEGMDSALTITPTGTAMIGYYSIAQDASEISVNVAKGSFGAWSFEEVMASNTTEGGDAIGPFTTIAYNPSSDAGDLVFANSTRSALMFAEGTTGGSYNTEDIETFGIPQSCSLANNPGTLRPGVAYQRTINEDLYYAERGGGGEWTRQPVDSNAGVGFSPSLCYSEVDGTPWISYYDANFARLKVAYYDTDAWAFVTIPAPDSSADYGNFSSIAWHPAHDRPAVAFYDSAAGKLWYVFIGTPLAPQAAVEVTGGVNLEGAYCSLRFSPDSEQPGIAYQDVTNGDLRYVERHAE